MARAGLNTAAVVDAAIGLIDGEGPQAMTLAAIAGRTNVATPSLYKHVDGLSGLRALVAIRVINELTEQVTAAVIGHSGAAALRRLMLAYRQYVLDHPHRYAAMPQQPLADPQWLEASRRLLDLHYAILAGAGITGSDAVDLIRSVRAATHGFATLQSSGGFQMSEDVDASYEVLIALLSAGLPRQ